MNINFQSLIKDQIVFLLLPIIVLAVLIGGSGYMMFNAYTAFDDNNKKQEQVQSLTDEKTSLEAKLIEQQNTPVDPNAKKIYTLEGTQFGADASFAPLFEHMINVAKLSGIRIKSVDYNFSPSDDPIFQLKNPGQNVCELSTVVVGNYPSLQAFLKTILSEDYLVNLVQVELVPWKRDKSILIAYLKLRFYTQT